MFSAMPRKSSAKNTKRWEVLCDCLIINLMEVAWCQFALAETVRQTTDERKMARVNSSQQRMESRLW